MRGKLFLLASASFIFNACTSDLGYDPSSRYDGKPVEYIVKCGHVFCSSGNDNDNIPKCTEELEGAIFFIKQQEASYACIDGQWTKKREMALKDAERYGAKQYEGVYDPEGKQKSSSSYGRSSSSNRYGYDDDDWDDDWYDDYYRSSSSSARSSSSVASSSSRTPVDYGNVIDSRDNTVYRTVTIGTQTWMADNLVFKGEDIFYASYLDDMCQGGLCVLYGQPESNLCPEGFHIPSEADWATLYQYAGDVKHLKSTTFTQRNGIPGGIDTYGFDAEPVGFGDIKEELEDSELLGYHVLAWYWTQENSIAMISRDSEDFTTSKTLKYKDYNSNQITRTIAETDFFAIRCVGDN